MHNSGQDLIEILEKNTPGRLSKAEEETTPDSLRVPEKMLIFDLHTDTSANIWAELTLKSS